MSTSPQRNGEARSRCRRRRIDPASPRPSELLAAFFAVALVYLFAAAGAGLAYAVSGADWLHWLALHLLLLGGLSQLVLGAAQFFTCAFLATDPPPRRLVAIQLVAWNAGTLLVLTGDPTAIPALVEAGAGLLAIALIALAAALRGMQRRSLQRMPWALRWYATSAVWLALGGLAGVLLARQTPWTDGDLLGAHLAFTLVGWLGTAIIGTLHTFFPSLTQTQLRYPRLQRATYALWSLGVAELAIGAAFASQGVVAAAWSDLLLASALLCANMVASLRAAPRPIGLSPRLLALAQAFLLAALALALAATIGGGVEAPFTGTWRSRLAILVLVGWLGLTVVGSLLHLLAILARIRHFRLVMPTPRPAREHALTALAGASITMLAASQLGSLKQLALPASALTLVLGAAAALRIVQLAARALAPRSNSSEPRRSGRIP